MIKEHIIEAALMSCSETTLGVVHTRIQEGFVYSMFGAKGSDHML